MNKPFVHLHVHSEYSLLDGAIRCSELAERASRWGCPAAAITDHGTMYGVIEHYEKCKARGVKPLIGCEVYVDPRGHTCRDRMGKNFHLLLLAETQEGYKNLVKLVSIANTEGFYYKPRVDHELLSAYQKGLLASSACLSGEIPSLILENDESGARERVEMYRDIFGPENFFLEIMHNSLREQAVVNKELVRFSRETGIPLIATNDAHYLEAGDAAWHDVLLCVQTNSTVNTQNRYRFGSNDFYLRSPEEMWELFGTELPEALENTLAIAERCNVEFSFEGHLLPEVPVPKGRSLEETLGERAREGLRDRFGVSIPEHYLSRLEYELDVISQMGFSGYFLIVADIIQAAKSDGIPVGPGRGSAAGSLVAYSLKITEVDPLRYDLLFERFLNPERISMPDIDTDISDKRRDQVLEHIVEKYGRDNVGQIITFDRMKSKAAVRDVGRALDMPYPDVDRVARLIPAGVSSIGEAMEQNPELKQLHRDDMAVRKLLDYASRIEGLARHCSQHAAGVVITPGPLTDYLPVRRIGDNQIVTQYAMEPVEKLGLVKMDFLGLRTLSMLEETLENIKVNGKTPPDIYNLPLDDQKTYELLSRGDTLGVFQLESAGMRQLLKRLLPDCFEDLIAVLALYRPGPLGSGMVDQYVECKHGRQKASYLHPLLEDILKETHGVILYQEQVMQCAATLAGYTLGQADLLRRAMGKKKVEVMERERAHFVEGCGINGIDSKKAEQIFDIIQEFAGYGFNKSHSTAYAMISYQTAYLKAHFPVEFMAAFLSSHIHSKLDVLARYVRAVKSAGISVLPPDINKSGSLFTVDGEEILFGLGAVSKVGGGAVEAILAAREGGPFESLWDFLNKVDVRVVGKCVVENLIKAGAFDAISANRKQLLDSLQPMVEIVQRRASDGRQRSLLTLVEEEEDKNGPQLVDTEDFDFHTRMTMEKEATGLYISGHPCEHYESLYGDITTCTIGELPFWKSSGCRPVVAGVVVDLQEKFTKRGDKMAVFEIEDVEGKVEAVCFPKTWNGLEYIPEKGEVCIITGKLHERDGVNLVVDSILPVEKAKECVAPAVRLRIYDTGKKLNGCLTDVYRELKGYPGEATVYIEYVSDSFRALLRSRRLKVDPGKPFEEQIRRISGGAVEVV